MLLLGNHLQEALQLTKAQQACIAERGVALFDQLRRLRDQRNSLAEPFAEVSAFILHWLACSALDTDHAPAVMPGVRILYLAPPIKPALEACVQPCVAVGLQGMLTGMWFQALSASSPPSSVGGAAPAQLTRFSSLLNIVSSIKQQEMQALSTTLHKLFANDVSALG